MLLRDLEQKIVKIINESGLPIDAIYFIMKSLMQEIDQNYNKYCKEEDLEKAKQREEEEQEKAEKDKLE